MVDGVQHGRGLSLLHALQPESEVEKNNLIANYACAACQDTVAVQTELSAPQNLGFVVYVEAIKQCRCQFQNRIYVVINNIMRKTNSFVQEASKALKAAESRDLLPDPRIDEAMVQLLLADKRGDVPAAVGFAEVLTALDQYNAHMWYNLAWFYGELGSDTEAVAAYERCLLLAPDLADAWYNQGIICARLGDYTKARDCLEHFHRLRPDSSGAMFQDFTILEAEQGLSGEVNVVEDKSSRYLRINQQTQSSAFLNPPAKEFALDSAGPGALPACFYLSAWFMPGSNHADGHGLVLGLGGGAGVTALLAQFPKLELTVVEIDPKVVSMVRKWFPLIQHYMDEKRLHLRSGCAEVFVKESDQRYDFAIIDLYTGASESPGFSRTASFLTDLAVLTPNIWTNLISSQSGDYLRDSFRAFTEAGLPLQHVFTTISPKSRGKIGSNWITSTESVDLEALRGVKLFEDLKPCSELDIVRGNFQILTQWVISADEIRDFVDTGRLPDDGESGS